MSVFALALSASACAGTARRAERADVGRWEGRGRECVRPFLGRESAYRWIEADAQDDPTLAEVPAQARRTARAAGIEPLVAAALREAKRQGAEPSVTWVLIRQDLSMRLISLETQLAAMIFEAECTGELIEAMTFSLEARQRQRELALAIASLATGAVAATSAGIWDLANGDSVGPAVVGLVGGAGSAALAGAAFVPRTHRLSYTHRHNLLTPVVNGSDPEQAFPPAVFRLLTLPSTEGGLTPREQLITQWQELIAEEFPPAEQASVTRLLYGEGGMYDEQLMSLRERMYDALETKLNAQARDLELLDRYLVRALEQPRLLEKSPP